MPYDPRALANLILDIREEQGQSTTNLELQKLLYFCHANHLSLTGRPLASGVFEAWRNGPVNPAVYKAFKEFADKPITKRARKRNYATNSYEELNALVPEPIRSDIEQLVSSLSRLSAWQLVELSHAPGGPWDYVVCKSKNGFVAGMRITDEIVKEKHRNTKRVFGENQKEHQPVEPFERKRTK